MNIKYGMILAAGLGKRMQPLTLKTPKPLLEINNYTLLERAINLLISHGVQEICRFARFLNGWFRLRVKLSLVKLSSGMSVRLMFESCRRHFRPAKMFTSKGGRTP